MIKYNGMLTKSDTINFLNDFYGLEPSKDTHVLLHPAGHDIIAVTLESEGIIGDLLGDSFKDGLLHNWGWAKKFNKACKE